VSEEFDSLGNPVVDPDNIAMTRGRERRAPPKGNRNEDREVEGNRGVNRETDDTRSENWIQVRIPQETWDKARQAMSGAVPMAADATREDLMTYQYLLHR
jgi:hypothetical protein